ncbi:MAG TPA: hypothetical protein VKP64_09240 [Mycobacteriales bacterium]|nr:hypothetical protein [Mycobacteriales bacterium]
MTGAAAHETAAETATGALTGPQAAAEVKAAVSRLGGAFTVDPAMHAACAAAGYPDWALGVAGRAAPLGEVPPDIVAAALVFFPADHVVRACAATRAVSPPSRVLETFLGACHGWGRAHLAGVDGLDVVCPLLDRVVASADAAGVPLFAGWRAVPQPDDLPARAAHLLHLLREHRTGLHALVVLAADLSPLEAILAAPHGEAAAAVFGWTPPYPPVAHVRDRWEAAEERTDALVGRAYGAALAPAELATMVRVLPAALDAVYPPEETAVE